MEFLIDSEIIFQLILAIILGALLGLEREYKKKEAGLKTYALVCLGSAIFTIIAFLMGQGLAAFDPSRIIQAIATGIGFLGAGAIMQRDFHIEGLTTAAALWTTAAIGVAIGAKLYFIAIFSTLLVVIVLVGSNVIKDKILKIKQ